MACLRSALTSRDSQSKGEGGASGGRGGEFKREIKGERDKKSRGEDKEVGGEEEEGDKGEGDGVEEELDHCYDCAAEAGAETRAACLTICLAFV